MTRAEVRENLLVALDTLRSRKIRSALTILGIVIGVTSVITVAAIIEGLNGMVASRVQKFGSQTLFVMRIPPGTSPFTRRSWPLPRSPIRSRCRCARPFQTVQRRSSSAPSRL